jgi:hypothetical protein
VAVQAQGVRRPGVLDLVGRHARGVGHEGLQALALLGTIPIPTACTITTANGVEMGPGSASIVSWSFWKDGGWDVSRVPVRLSWTVRASK